MDPKSKKIYDKIENFLEERKGRERRDTDQPSKEAITAATASERRKKQDRRSSRH